MASLYEHDFQNQRPLPGARVGIREELSDLITSRVILPAQLTQDHLGQARVVVLANDERLTEQQAHWVNEFVRDGGGLLIFLGDRVNVDWYNRSLAPSGLMPLSIASLAGSAEAAAPSAKDFRK